jgi:indolepyruvate ferredoxin oxidoreductase
LRTYDLVQYADLEYARQYVDWVRQVQAWDNAEWGYAATKAVIWNLHKVMLIKDEVYVAHLLTSEEKQRRDRARFDIDPARGDRLRYRHLNRPQFAFLGREFAWDMRTRDWMLRLMRRLRWLRRLLPEWHRPERDFRDWYLGLLPRGQTVAHDAHRYQLFVRLLELPRTVTGYREIRYPKMAAAQAQAEALLRELDSREVVAKRLVPA